MQLYYKQKIYLAILPFICRNHTTYGCNHKPLPNIIDYWSQLVGDDHRKALQSDWAGAVVALKATRRAISGYFVIFSTHSFSNVFRKVLLSKPKSCVLNRVSGIIDKGVGPLNVSRICKIYRAMNHLILENSRAYLSNWTNGCRQATLESVPFVNS